MPLTTQLIEVRGYYLVVPRDKPAEARRKQIPSAGLLSFRRKLDDESRAVIGSRAECGNLASMEFDYPFGNGQSQSETAKPLLSGLLKWIENFGERAGSDANPAVNHFQTDSAILRIA
jgi:hypothetical protein